MLSVAGFQIVVIEIRKKYGPVIQENTSGQYVEQGAEKKLNITNVIPDGWYGEICRACAHLFAPSLTTSYFCQANASAPGS